MVGNRLAVGRMGGRFPWSAKDPEAFREGTVNIRRPAGKLVGGTPGMSDHGSSRLSVSAGHASGGLRITGARTGSTPAGGHTVRRTRRITVLSLSGPHECLAPPLAAVNIVLVAAGSRPVPCAA